MILDIWHTSQALHSALPASKWDQTTPVSAFLERLNMTAELEAILQQRQVGHISRWTRGFDLGDDGRKFIALQCLVYSGFEALHATHCSRPGNAGAATDPFQVRACAARCRK